MDTITHKLLHGLVGGTTGLILEGEKGIIPGTLGAMVAESVMEFSKSKLEGMAINAAQETMEEEETSSSSQMPSKHQLFEDSLRQTQDIAKLITASTLMMLGVDGVNVGIETATTAVENNFVPAVILVYYTATTLYSLYDAYQVYEEEGMEAAAESLVEDAALSYVGGKGLAIALKTAGKLATSAKVGTKAKAFFQKFVAKGEKVVEQEAKKIPEQVHHFATNKHKTFRPKLEEIAKEYGLSLNGSWNKAKLQHLGRHPDKYHEFVTKGMIQAQKEAGGDVTKFLELFEKYVKKPVIENPDLLNKSGW